MVSERDQLVASEPLAGYFPDRSDRLCELVFDENAHDFDWRAAYATALPREVIQGKFTTDSPFIAISEWAQHNDALSLGNARFRAEGAAACGNPAWQRAS